MAITLRESRSLKSVFGKIKTAKTKLSREEFEKHFGKFGQQLTFPSHKALLTLRRSLDGLIAEQAKTNAPFSQRTAELIRNTTNFKENKMFYAIQDLGRIKNPAIYNVLKAVAFKNPFSSAKVYAVLALANFKRPEGLGIAVRVSKNRRISENSCRTMFYELEQAYNGFIKSKDMVTQAVFKAVQENFKDKPAAKRLIFLTALLFDKVPGEISKIEEGRKFLLADEFASNINTLMYKWNWHMDKSSVEQLMKKFNLPMA